MFLSGVRDVAMEASGVAISMPYTTFKLFLQVTNALESTCQVLYVNNRHHRYVPKG